MLILLFKSMVCLALLFGLYKLLLGKTTFFRANHATLILISLLSVVIPFIEIPESREVAAVGYVDEIMLGAGYVGLAPAAEAGEPLTWQNILALIYLVGVAYCLLNILRSAVANFLFIRRTPAYRKETDYTLLLTDAAISPYSLGRYVIMSKPDYEQNGEAILTHELCHVRRRHTVSVMLMNVLSAVLWLNPIVWLVREELLLVCEYEADTAVISKGIDAKEYQLLLIKKAVSPSRYTIANSLNHSSLKKRITMMRKSQSTFWARLRYPCIALAAAAILPAFAHKGLISPIEETLKENLVEELKSEITSIAPVLSESEAETGGKGMDFSATGQIMEQETDAMAQDNTPESVGQKNDAANPEALNSAPETDDVNFKVRAKDGETPLIFIDGKISTIEMKDALNPSDIERIEVVKDPKILQSMGDKAKYGIIYITTKNADKDAARDVAQEMPQFKEGNIQLFMMKNLKYPEKAHKEKKEGRVIVQFVIKKDGSVGDVNIVRGVCEELDAEAVRVVNATSGNWIPGKENGEPVNCKFTLPVIFRLT